MTKILSVNQLEIAFWQEKEKSYTPVVHGIDFHINQGEVFALVGESGSGKSVSAMSLVKLLPANQSLIKAESITYCSPTNQDSAPIPLNRLSVDALRAIRGREIGVVFQDPLSALNPVQRVGDQVAEVFALHRPEISPKQHRKAIIELFDQVGIKQPHEKIRNYPHQLSGGMRQRVMIAMALAARPKLLIADEPTTSLDVTIQAKILSLLQDLQAEYGMSLLFISHDLAVVRAISDRVAVMYQGRIVEENETEALINNPQHAYTKKLIGASRLQRARE